MNQCIFHIGMPKTGTSSIQESLYHGLKDPNFYYIDLGQGQANACRVVATVFGDAPEHYHYHRQLGLSREAVDRDRRRLHRQLEQILEQRAALGQTLILSSEEAWRMTQQELQRLRDFMADRHYGVKVVAYLRSWKPWLESNFQQKVKIGTGTRSLVPEAPVELAYGDRLQTLEAVFGADQVEVYPYHPKTFPNGCVVQDFCQRLGISFDTAQIRRSNDSLTLPAIKLLYTYRQLGPSFGVGRQALFTDWVLRQRLRELSGPAVRFHSSLVEPLVQQLAAQSAWLEERLGYRFDADIYKGDGADCIRQEADLFDYDRGSLEWLAAATGWLANDDPREVAAQMHHLRYHPTLSSVTAQIYSIGRAKLASSLQALK